MLSIQDRFPSPLRQVESIDMDSLPEEIFVIIFSFLPLSSRARCSLVSRKWHRLANENNVLSLAFGRDKWAFYFGVDIGEEPLLPSNLRQLLKSSPSFLKGKKVEEACLLFLVPSHYNGKPLTLNAFSLLAKAAMRGHVTFLKFIFSKITEQFENQSIKASYWVLMTKTIVLESKGQDYLDQQKLVSRYAEEAKIEYRIPYLFEAIVGMITAYTVSGKSFFSGYTFTRCQESIQESQPMLLPFQKTISCQQVVVGNFGKSCLSIGLDVYDIGQYGTAIIWKI